MLPWGPLQESLYGYPIFQFKSLLLIWRLVNFIPMSLQMSYSNLNKMIGYQSSSPSNGCQEPHPSSSAICDNLVNAHVTLFSFVLLLLKKITDSWFLFHFQTASSSLFGIGAQNTRCVKSCPANPVMVTANMNPLKLARLIWTDSRTVVLLTVDRTETQFRV